MNEDLERLEFSTLRLSRHLETLVEDLAHDASYTKNSTSIWDLVWKCKDFRCSDPRDRVFGLLSLERLQPYGAIRPDYSNSVTDVLLQLLDQKAMCDKGAKWDPFGWDFDHIRDVVERFGLSSESPNIATMRDQRRDVVDEEDLHSDRTQLSLFANPNENSRIVLTVRSHCKVWQNEIGQYIVPAERSNASWRENEHFEVEKSNARSLQTPAGHVVGLANKQIRSGDILLLFRIDGDRKIFPAGLITRPCDGKMHLIVGQFVVDDDIPICHNEASCACEGHHEGDGLGSSTWKVHMLPEDLLLFVTQDLNLRPKQGSTPSRTERREERTRPLTTRVISQPFSSYAMLKPEHPLSEEYRR